MKRKHSPTSKEGEEFIKPFKPTHREKIFQALKELRVGGTYEEIAQKAGMRDDQVWKRLSELERGMLIFNTSITRKLRSGVSGIVWQVVGETCSGEKPVIEKKKVKQTAPSVEVNPLFG